MHSPIIYLDQCHWITLAQAQFAKHKVRSSDELAAAEFFLQAATNGQIRLPLSGAHMVETMKAGNGARRHQLADTMLAIYDGWHMNNPITVRGWEMKNAFIQQNVSLDRNQIFNQRPGTPYGIEMPYAGNDQTLPLEIQRFVEDMSWRCSWADMLRSATYEASEWAAIWEALQRWVSAHQTLSTYLRDHPANRDLRGVVAGHTLTDLQQEIAMVISQIELPSDELEKRLQAGNLIAFFLQLPLVGRVMEITHIRLRNPQDVWTENDLIDLLFLSCATAYADFVVAERKSTHMLRQAARQTTSGAPVFATLSELHSVLDV